MSRFVAFEGIDASGKSTQLRLLAERLAGAGVPVLTTREPGGSPLSEKIRALLLHGEDMRPETEALLFAAARAQHVREVIRPALESGKHVLVDRYILSSLAYQATGRGLDARDILDINKMAMDGLWPDRVFLFDIAPEKAMERKYLAKQLPDRMEAGGLDWLRTLRRGYLDWAAKDARIAVLDADRDVAALSEEVWGIWKQDDEG